MEEHKELMGLLRNVIGKMRATALLWSLRVICVSDILPTTVHSFVSPAYVWPPALVLHKDLPATPKSVSFCIF